MNNIGYFLIAALACSHSCVAGLGKRQLGFTCGGSAHRVLSTRRGFEVRGKLRGCRRTARSVCGPYQTLQDAFGNKPNMGFVQQAHLPELTDSVAGF